MISLIKRMIYALSPLITIAIMGATYNQFSPGGDLTGTWNSQTVVSGAITLAKQANLPAYTVNGNNTASSATPLALNPVAVTTMLGNPINVDLIGPGTPITLSGIQVVDGVTTNINTVLVRGQASDADNGIYITNTSGAWVRSFNFPSGAVISANCTVSVIGTVSNALFTSVNVGRIFRLTTTSAITIGTDAQIWLETPLGATPGGINNGIISAVNGQYSTNNTAALDNAGNATLNTITGVVGAAFTASAATSTSSGAGGAATLLGGIPIEGNGGPARLTARNGVTATATARNGGNIVLTRGTGVSGGNDGIISMVGPVVQGGTKYTFATNTCSATTTLGGATWGSYVSGTTGTCTVTITLPFATNSYFCQATDQTTSIDYTQNATTSGLTLTITGTTVSGDLIKFGCGGY